MPNLASAACTGITCSPATEVIAIRLADNGILLINPRQRKLQVKIKGTTIFLFFFYQNQGIGFSGPEFHTGLIAGPNHNLVFNGAEGSLQFFDVFHDTCTINLDVSGLDTARWTHKKRFIKPPHVTHVAFSPDGTWLVSSDVRFVGSEKVVSLKFWKYNLLKQTYEIVVQADGVHDDVTAIAYHPLEDTCVTCGDDGNFKFWKVSAVDKSDPMINGNLPDFTWGNSSAGTYRNTEIADADFSPDGSLLSLCYDSVITLWDPKSNTLLRTLSYPTAKERLISAKFFRVSSHMVAMTKNHVFVWDLLSCNISWALNVEVS